MMSHSNQRKMGAGNKNKAYATEGNAHKLQNIAGIISAT